MVFKYKIECFKFNRNNRRKNYESSHDNAFDWQQSCCLSINKTIDTILKLDQFTITVADLWNRAARFSPFKSHICFIYLFIYFSQSVSWTIKSKWILNVDQLLNQIRAIKIIQISLVVVQLNLQLINRILFWYLLKWKWSEKKHLFFIGFFFMLFMIVTTQSK